MNILHSLQYWFLMIFVQFAPLDSLKTGDVYHYKVMNSEKSLHLTVTETRRRYVKIKASYATGSVVAGGTHTAVIQKQGKSWTVTSFLSKGRNMLMGKKDWIPLNKDSFEKLMLSIDKKYLFFNIKSGKSTVVYGSDVFQTKNVIYKINKDRVLVEAASKLGLIRAEISFPLQKISARIRLLRKVNLKKNDVK